jgi:riboflavin synthase alpha subunit
MSGIIGKIGRIAASQLMLSEFNFRIISVPSIDEEMRSVSMTLNGVCAFVKQQN